MKSPEVLIEGLLERVEAYGIATLELSKLKALETTTIVATSILSKLGTIASFAVFFIILNVGIALLLGDWLGKYYYGFFIVALIFLATGVVFYFYLYQWIKKPVSDFIITKSLQ